MTSCLPVHSSHKLWDNWGALCVASFPDNPGLTQGYVGAEDVVDDGEPFEEKMGRLAAKLGEQFRESERLEGEIAGNLKGLGYQI
ncbi:MAG: hypothetical protein WC593_08205 [Methanoregula sp.]